MSGPTLRGAASSTARAVAAWVGGIRLVVAAVVTVVVSTFMNPGVSAAIFVTAATLSTVTSNRSEATQVGVLQQFDPGRASFEIRSEQVDFSLRRLAIPLMPGETFEFEVRANGRRQLPADGYTAETNTGRIQNDLGRWSWTAPREPGFAEIVVHRGSPPDSVSILLMILVPLDRMVGDALEGYRIGKYPETALRGLAAYRNPPGLIRVRPEDRGIQVSPHFTLGQFLCKQDGGFPKFVLVKPKLLQKLERLLERANEEGIAAPTFHVMSGYRTPYYNKVIDNVRYSRHIYGDAADVFVDFQPKDGNMDDVNRDGRVDMDDSRHLASLVEDLVAEGLFSRLIGGVGVYRANPAHGPFVHVDTRGSRARW